MRTSCRPTVRDPVNSSRWLSGSREHAELLHHAKVIAHSPMLGYPAIFQAEHMGKLGSDVARIGSGMPRKLPARQ